MFSNESLASFGCIPKLTKTLFKSGQGLMSYGFSANDAIIVFTLYFLQSLMFCINRPKICDLIIPSVFNIVENEKPIIILFLFASLHKTWLRPEFLWCIESLVAIVPKSKTIFALLFSIACLSFPVDL